MPSRMYQFKNEYVCPKCKETFYKYQSSKRKGVKCPYCGYMVAKTFSGTAHIGYHRTRGKLMVFHATLWDKDYRDYSGILKGILTRKFNNKREISSAVKRIIDDSSLRGNVRVVFGEA